MHLCNYRITNINVGSNLLGDEPFLCAQKLVGGGYSGVGPEVGRGQYSTRSTGVLVISEDL